MSKCNHPPQKLHSWIAYDGRLCVACSACGKVLLGEAPENAQEAPGEQISEEPYPGYSEGCGIVSEPSHGSQGYMIRLARALEREIHTYRVLRHRK